MFEGGHLFQGGRLLNNVTFWVGAYSRVDAYSKGALIRSITVLHFYIIFDFCRAVVFLKQTQQYYKCVSNFGLSDY